MADGYQVRGLRFTPAPHAMQQGGLLGWTGFTYGDLLLDHIAVRRTRAGRVALSFPRVRGKSGRPRVPVRPITAHARELIEGVVIAALRARGDLQ